MTERAIVCFGHAMPHFQWMQFHRDVAREFGRSGWTVVWVSPPGTEKNLRWWLRDIWDRVRGFFGGGWKPLLDPRASAAGVRRALSYLARGELAGEGMFWDFRPWGPLLLRRPGFGPLEAVALFQLRRALRRLGIGRPFVILYSPQELDLVRHLRYGVLSTLPGDDAMDHPSCWCAIGDAFL